MSVDAINHWIQHVWKQRLILYPHLQSKSLLILDSQKVHIGKDFKKEIRKHCDIAMVPIGMTKMLQPLSMSPYKTFKEQMTNEWNFWLTGQNEQFRKTKLSKPPTNEEICEWIIKSWNRVSPHSIKNGFRKAGVEYVPELNDYLEIIWEDSNEKLDCIGGDDYRKNPTNTFNQLVFLSDDEDIIGFYD